MSPLLTDFLVLGSSIPYWGSEFTLKWVLAPHIPAPAENQPGSRLMLWSLVSFRKGVSHLCQRLTTPEVLWAQQCQGVRVCVLNGRGASVTVGAGVNICVPTASHKSLSILPKIASYLEMMLSWLLRVWICSTIHRSSWEHLWSMQFLAMIWMSLATSFPEAEIFLAEAMSWSLVYIREGNVRFRQTLPSQVSPAASETNYNACPKLSWLNLFLPLEMSIF